MQRLRWSFYSLSRRAYSGTRGRRMHRRRRVSIRCREGRTAELEKGVEATSQSESFYSLSRRAYSGTPTCAGPTCAGPTFLFAVAKGVQRNVGTIAVVNASQASFLFAVAKGVQRNPGVRAGRPLPSRPGFYSLSRRAYSGTKNQCVYPEVRDQFLFAVAKGVQRNEHRTPAHGRQRPRFYSLSRRAYSGTIVFVIIGKLFGRFYSLSRRAYSGTLAAAGILAATPSGFYSLSRRAYSGTV